MKLKDMPTPETDAFYAGEYSPDIPPEIFEASVGKEKRFSESLEKRLAIAVAENARLKAAMDKYSEDEMSIIERCAKVAEVMGFKHSECPEMSEYCADAIRALKEGK
jgi:hypothetical protein